MHAVAFATKALLELDCFSTQFSTYSQFSGNKPVRDISCRIARNAKD